MALDDTRSAFPLDIAIIGLAGRFPGASGTAGFWRNLVDGVESIVPLSDAELEAHGINRFTFNAPNYVKAAAALEGCEDFDADFFKINAKEAELMDPQHRIFLECAVEAMENAGYDPLRCEGSVGVYGGTGINTYLTGLLRGNEAGVSRTMVVVGNDKDYVATRVSYKLNLRGPSLTVQTACSTSLVAIHLACQSLLTGESDMALAGAVSVSNHIRRGYYYTEGGMVAPDGHCRPFDADAQGTVFGDGVGIVVLKRLDRALADGDCIRAVIKGSAINNDGLDKVGYTAPSVNRQAAVVAEALAVADISPDTISYVEAHGTGTSLGDPIELAALTQVFGGTTDRTAFCGIGSVKANIGHLNAAAGVAGLIKVILAMQHELLPPLINFRSLNPQIDLQNSPFQILTEPTRWPRGAAPRRAGVSSFGVGGTNAHLVVEEAPRAAVIQSAPSERPAELLLISGRTPEALDTIAKDLASRLRDGASMQLTDVAFTMNTGRTVHDRGWAIVATDVADAIAQLEGGGRRTLYGQLDLKGQREVVFMFPGQGSQHAGMAAGLYASSNSVFRRELDRCVALLRPVLDRDLLDVIYPQRGSNAPPASLINETEWAQPAIFGVSYALARQWMEWGVRPRGMIGHSVGELVAACIAGVMPLEAALHVVAARAKLMQACPRGAMLAIAAAPEEVAPAMPDGVVVAVVNGPAACVASGSLPGVEELQRLLVDRGIACSLLRTSHAYHSPLMAAAAEPLTRTIRQFQLSPPMIPYISNVSGDWITDDEATDPDYWARHLLEPVQFLRGLRTLTEGRADILLEAGPRRTLTTLARQTGAAKDAVYVSSLPHGSDTPRADWDQMLRGLGEIWLGGIAIDWAGFYRGEKRRRVVLGTYPFERRRFSVIDGDAEPPTAQSGPISGKIDNAFHTASWRRGPAPLEPPGLKGNWLVFAADDPVSEQLASSLKAEGAHVTVVTKGERFADIEDGSLQIVPHNQRHYDLVIKTLATLNRLPRRVVYLWGVEAAPLLGIDDPAAYAELDRVFFGLMHLIRALGENAPNNPVEIACIGSGTQEVTGGDMTNALAAMMLGPVIVAPEEYPSVTTRFIDLPALPADRGSCAALAANLLQELGVNAINPLVALRGPYRWLQTQQRISLPPPIETVRTIAPGAVVLITGGLGDLGLAIAESLATEEQAKLILVGRTGLPPRGEWDGILAGDAAGGPIAAAIRTVRSLEDKGSEVLIGRADAADINQMQDVVTEAYERFGEINGVIHAAGVAGVGPIGTKDRDGAMRVLAPKVIGLAVLDKLFRGRSIDFLALFSSVNALHGMVGQVDYAAANNYLDAVARLGRTAWAKRVVSINWDAWSEVGMAVKTQLPPQLQAARREALRFGLQTAEGVDAFRRVIAKPLAQVAVSMRDMNRARIVRASANRRRGARTVTAQAADAAPETMSGRHPRPRLRQEYVAPETEMERVMAAIWADLLQVDKVGVADDFFDLGGHSLLALQLLPLINERFRVTVTQKELFSAPTLGGLAVLVEDKLISEIENVSDDAASEALAAS